MMLKRAVFLTVFVAASSAMGRPAEAPKDVAGLSPVPTAAIPADPFLGNFDKAALTPRQIFAKPNRVAMPGAGITGRLIVKFRDEVQARVAADGKLTSRNNADLREADLAIARGGATLKHAITLPENSRKSLENRAAAMSNKAQPDLGGFMYVEPPVGAGPGALEQLANELNARPDVEFVEFEPEYVIANGGDGGIAGGGDPIGACCVPSGQLGTPPLTVICVDGVTEEVCSNSGGLWLGDATFCPNVACTGVGACCLPGGTECETLTEDQCLGLQGLFKGIGTSCALDEGICDDPDCGVPGTGDCFECHDPLDPFSAGLFCDDAICCEAVCDVDPFCCDEDATSPGRGPPHWDAICVALAFQFCGGPLNVCDSPFSGSCFEAHPERGCSTSGCCLSVCSAEPFCCDVEWDDLCVALALDLCTDGPGGGTPSFTDAQGYLTPSPYPSPVPANIANGIYIDTCTGDPLTGYTGEGWAMHGLWTFGQQIQDLVLESSGRRVSNFTRGRSIKVGIIEHTAFADWNDPSRTHEDLRGKVIAEPNQTLIIVPDSESLSGNHGTACLGIVGAKDDGLKGHGPGALIDSGEIGMVGIAPEAQLYFFPIVSLEEGGRLLNAIAKALETFGPGDVLSFSIGPGAPAGATLATSAANWQMLSMARDLGVTCCIAAGNSCANVDGQAQANNQDCGVVIVGACYPGFPYCRLGFSNFCRNCTAPNQIHCSAWGTGVATLGYGDLFLGSASENNLGHKVRSYTNSFGGTSAACPQVAALIANLQGLSKMVHGVPLTPGQIRAAVANGTPQCGFPNSNDLPGATAGNECVGDYDFDQAPNKISVYPSTQAAAEAVLSLAFVDGNPLLDDLTLIRGQFMFGNEWSIRGIDANYFIATSLYTPRNHRPNFQGPAGQVAYLGEGQTVDLMVAATSDRKLVHSIQVEVAVQTPGPTTLNFVELYDWTTSRWVFANFTTLTGAEGSGTVLVQALVPAAQRFIRASDRKILIRNYMLAPGLTNPGTSPGSGSGQAPFIARIDMVRVVVFSGLGGGETPGGGAGAAP